MPQTNIYFTDEETALIERYQEEHNINGKYEAVRRIVLDRLNKEYSSDGDGSADQ